MAENTRYQTAQACAGEALEALYTVYWEDSFDAALLESRLTGTIHFFIRNARSLAEPHPYPEQLEQGEPGAMVKDDPLGTIASVGQGRHRMGGTMSSDNPVMMNLGASPSPEVLRLLAIGSPEVVNDCVLTLYRLGYARPEDWSQPLPTVNPGEVMRILTRRRPMST